MRLYLLRLGEISRIGAPVPGYLILADDGSAVLVDTGPPPAPPSGPGAMMPAITPAAPVTEQIARLGVTPADVRYVVCTHLDPDHSGGHHLFPGAEFVIQRSHLAAARSGSVDRLGFTRDSWGSAGLRYREVAGDVELLPGIHLIRSDGHVPGHQSVLVRLPATGSVLLAADAIPLAICKDPDTRPMTPFDLDHEAVRASTRRLAELARAEDALVVCGHDPGQWADIVTAPGHYA